MLATRYHTCVEVSKENAYELYEQVSALVDIAEMLSVQKISQLTVQALQAAMHITDYSPGLPAHSG